MSFIGDFVGGAADAGAGIINAQIANDAALEKAKSFSDYNQQLELQKLQTIQDMTQERNASDADKIKSAVSQVQQGRAQQAAQSSSDAMQSSALQSDPHAMGPVDPDDPTNPARTIVSMNDAKQILTDPSQMKKYGIVNANRSQTLGDQADAAIALGRNDLAKDFQGQQQIEISNQNAARMAQAQIQTNAIQQQRADAQDDRNTNAEKRNADMDKYHTGMLAVMSARIGANGADGDDTAAIKTAKAIQADELSRGNKISLSDAIDLTHKAADVGNAFAMNYAKMQQENGLIGADKNDSTQPAKGKLFANVNDALTAGMRAYVNPRGKTSAASAIPALGSANPGGLPPGAVQIGTSGGKPVYQTPDGKQFIAN